MASHLPELFEVWRLRSLVPTLMDAFVSGISERLCLVSPIFIFLTFNLQGFKNLAATGSLEPLHKLVTSLPTIWSYHPPSLPVQAQSDIPANSFAAYGDKANFFAIESFRGRLEQ